MHTKAESEQILKLRFPSEISEEREIDQESTFCATFKIEEPIYVTKFVPIMTEDTNHIALVGLETHKNLKLGKCSTFKANASDEWQNGGQNWVDTLFVTGITFDLPPEFLPPNFFECSFL